MLIGSKSNLATEKTRFEFPRDSCRIILGSRTTRSESVRVAGLRRPPGLTNKVTPGRATYTLHSSTASGLNFAAIRILLAPLAAGGRSWQDNRMATSPTPALAIVLAAGKGTRMESELPKVLVPVCGRPMLRYVTDALREAGVEQTVVVVGYQAELVRAELASEPSIDFAEQHEQLGTGHAVMMCREQLAQHQGPVMIIAGDQCMVQVSSVRKLFEIFGAEHPACLLGTVDKDDPTGYGRIVRGSEGQFVGIVEEKDATDVERAIHEVNVSTYVFEASELLAALDQLTSENAQQEYYLTDCPALLLAAGKRVAAHKVLQPCESMSINNMAELRRVEEEMEGSGG